MSNKTLGEMISSLRKEKNMTQNDLAEKMNVTDKAVSKWERNLSCPDVNSIPKLAEILGVSVEELLNAQTKKENNTAKNNSFKKDAKRQSDVQGKKKGFSYAKKKTLKVERNKP